MVTVTACASSSSSLSVPTSAGKVGTETTWPLSLTIELKEERRKEKEQEEAYLCWWCSFVGDCCTGECPLPFQGDGACDEVCQVASCAFDFGDCDAVLDLSCEDKGCPSFLLGDGICDDVCDVEQCGFDAGDCFNRRCENEDNCNLSFLGNTFCDLECNTTFCGFDDGDCLQPFLLCPCSTTEMTNGVCDVECDIEACGFDQGECCGDVGCSLSSIGNGNCEEECNVKECSFDEGDCDNSLVAVGEGVYIIVGFSFGVMLAITILAFYGARRNRIKRQKRAEPKRGFNIQSPSEPPPAEYYDSRQWSTLSSWYQEEPILVSRSSSPEQTWVNTSRWAMRS